MKRKTNFSWLVNTEEMLYTSHIGIGADYHRRSKIDKQ